MTARPDAPTAPPILFMDRGCPFSHRILALLDHLGAPVERRESTIGDKPAGLERYSAAKHLPLLVHGDLVLTESRVIVEYLAEYHGWEDAYPTDVVTRSRHRHAMALVDRTIVPVLFEREHVGIDDPDLHDTVRTLAAATAPVAPRPCLLSLHVAPMWLRMRWRQPNGPLVRAVERHPALHRWLDATSELPCVTRTAPDRQGFAEDVIRARAAGLLGPTSG